MSAYIVSDDTINTVVIGISEHLNNMSELYRRRNYPLLSQDRETLGQALFALNVEAVNQRYGEGAAEEFRPLDYRFRPHPWSRPIVLYKCLRCLMYQCSEGNVPESPLFKELEAFRGDLADTIVCGLKAYNDAAWGL
jgi:hypothetical protein